MALPFSPNKTFNMTTFYFSCFSFLSLSLSLFCCLSLYFSVCLSVSYFHSWSFYVSLSFCPSFSLSLSLSLCLSLSIARCPSLSRLVGRSVCLSLSLIMSLLFSLYLLHHQPQATLIMLSNKHYFSSNPNSTHSKISISLFQYF